MWLQLKPRWLLRHVLRAVAVGTCYGFGRWQYGRAVSRPSRLNWSYTFEWALYGASPRRSCAGGPAAGAHVAKGGGGEITRIDGYIDSAQAAKLAG